MRFADKDIGTGHPVFLQAELGVTTMGDVQRSFELIEACAAAGLDAAKFIVTDPKKVERDPQRPYTYEVIEAHITEGQYATPRAATRTRPIGELTAETMFSLADWVKIRDFCHQQGLIFYATADHLEAVDLLEYLGVPAHKACSWDVAYTSLLMKMAATGKPVLVEFGTARWEEFTAAFDIAGEQFFPVLAPHAHGLRDWNLSRLSDAWGFSSPGRDLWPDLLALARGAVLLEKRPTLHRDELRGHHHAIGLEPDELKAWVREIRRAEAALTEAPWAGSPEAWAERTQNDRQSDGLRA